LWRTVWRSEPVSSLCRGLGFGEPCRQGDEIGHVVSDQGWAVAIIGSSCNPKCWVRKWRDPVESIRGDTPIHNGKQELAWFEARR